MFLCRLFYDAGHPWDGETLALKMTLIEATKKWERLTGGDAPCPVVFDAEDVREMVKLYTVLRQADEIFEAYRAIVGFESDYWVSTTHYDDAMAHREQLEWDVTAEEWARWFLDDEMDETKYM